ncbi:hypothetical protein D3C71_430720 [compost metagenome]
MRASVVLAATAVTRNTSAPVWLMVPANTASPAALSTGMLSPVTGAWSMALVPSSTTPSSGTRSPGRMRATASSATASARTVCQLPSGCRTSACSGASASRLWMALRARSTARASMSSAMAYSAITIAASGHWPMMKAPVTATAISALMLRRPRTSAAKPFL